MVAWPLPRRRPTPLLLATVWVHIYDTVGVWLVAMALPLFELLYCWVVECGTGLKPYDGDAFGRHIPPWRRQRVAKSPPTRYDFLLKLVLYSERC